MMPSASAAVFDALHMVGRVDALSGGAKESEIHVLVYLACLLWIYDHNPLEAWGYGFSTTPAGSPFADGLGGALQQLEASGLLEREVDVFRLSAAGHVAKARLDKLQQNLARTKFLDAAANTGLALALPIATGAVLQEPQLRGELRRFRTSPLLDEAGLALLEPHFTGLREATDEHGTGGLFSTAVLWLRYLAAAAEREVG